MKTKLLLPLTFIFFFINFGYCQDEITIDADRPDQSDGVYVLPKNRFQLEDGFVYKKEFLSNELMLRYGLTNSTEIRFIAEVGSDFKKTELIPFEISAKQRLFLQKGVFPAVTLVGYAEIPKKISEDDFVFSLLLAFENELADAVSVAYNVGGIENFELAKFSLCFDFELNDKWGAFAEFFSYFDSDYSSNNIDFGFLYLVNNKLQLDIAYGTKIAPKVENSFITMGASILF